jgi:hypothetical protein
MQRSCLGSLVLCVCVCFSFWEQDYWERTRGRGKTSRLGTVNYVQAAAEELPFGDSSYDGIRVITESRFLFILFEGLHSRYEVSQQLNVFLCPSGVRSFHSSLYSGPVRLLVPRTATRRAPGCCCGNGAGAQARRPPRAHRLGMGVYSVVHAS